MDIAIPKSVKGSQNVQAKLRIGQPNDQYEQEADAVADQVMKMPASQIPPIQRKCETCEEEEELQMKPLSASITPIIQKKEEEEELRMKPILSSNTPIIQKQSEGKEELRMKSLNSTISTVIQKEEEEEEEVRMKPLAASITPIIQKQSKAENELQMKGLFEDTIIQKEDEPTSAGPTSPETEAPVSSNNTLPNLTLQLPSPLILRANGVMYTSPTFLVQGPNGSIVDLAPYTGNGLVDFPLAALESLGIPILSYFHFHLGRARLYLGQHFDSAYGLSGGTSFIRNALHYGYITADDVTLFGAPSSYSFEHYGGIPNLNIVANPMDIGTMINVSYFNYPLEEGHNNPAVLFTITAPFDQNPFEAFVNLYGAIHHVFSGDLYNLPDVTHSYPRFQEEPNREIGTPTTTTQISPKADSKVSPSMGFESKLNAQKGGGQSLANPTREFMEQRIGADFSEVTVHTGTNATALNRDLGARAFTNANDIYFNQGQYNPHSSEGKQLLAHELTHVVQQSKARNGMNTIQRWQVSDDDSTELREPPPIGMSVSLSGLKFYVRRGLYFSAGSTRVQLMAAILRRLLEGQYRAGLEENVVAHLNANNVEWSGSLASDSTAVAGQIAVGEVTLDSPATLQLLSFLEETGLHPVLNEAQRELLNLGSSAKDIYNAIQGSNNPLPTWYTEWMFARVMASNADMLRRYHSTRLLYDGASISGSDGLIEQIRSYVGETADVLEEIRVDYELANFIDDLSARDGYRRLIGLNRLEARVIYAPPENLVPDSALNFMQYIRTQPNLLAEARNARSRSARITLLSRFERFYDRAHIAESMTDEHLADSAATATDMAWSAEMSSHPGLQPPLFEASIAANYRFTMSMNMDHWINHFALYSYQWERARITSPPSENNNEIELIGLPQRPTHGETMDLDRRRVRRYNEADITRVIESMGTAPNISAITLVAANTILRSFASELRGEVRRITESRNEKVVAFPEPGLFMVRCRAVPVLEGDEEVVRIPSVAYVIVNVMDPVDLAAEQHTRTMETRSAARVRIAEINQILEANMSHPDAASLEQELLILQDIAGEIDHIFSGRRTHIASQLDPLLRQQQDLEDRIASLEESDTTDRQELERARARLYLFRLQYSRIIRGLESQQEEVEEIEEARAGQHGDYEGPREQIDATFVNDTGVTINLVLEATQINADDEDTNDTSSEYSFVVADLTINSGGLGRGQGSSRLIAISNAVVDVLESHGDYGRGNLVLTIDGEHFHRPVQAGLGSIFMEALESVTMVASIAAIIAAPFTGGTSLYLLLPLGVAGALPSLYRLYQRYDASTLRPDLEVAMDVVNVVGGFIGLGHAFTTSMRLVQLGRVMLIAGLAADGAGYILMGAATVSQIIALRDLPEGQKNAQFIEIMFNALVQVGMIAGGTLAQFHAQRQAQQRRQARRQTHVDTTDPATVRGGDTDPSAVSGGPPTPAQEAQIGGVRGSDVYELAIPTDPGQRSIFSIIGNRAGPGVGDILRLMTESGLNTSIRPEFQQLMHGSRVSWDGSSPFYHLEIPVTVGGNTVHVRVEVTIRARGFDTRGTSVTPPRAGSHGNESGPASFSLEYIPPENGNPGRWVADVEVDPRLRLSSQPEQPHRSADFDTIVKHELDEISDMVVENHEHTGETQGTTYDGDVLSQNIAQQTEASMFRIGTESPSPPITSHDRAAARELLGHHEQMTTSGITPAERARLEGRFNRLLESMGFIDSIDMARFNQLMDALRSTGQTDPDFLLRVESQWQYNVSQQSLAAIPASQLLPGGRRVVTPEIMGHILEPGPSANFESSGISGGHETARLTAVNNDQSSPFFVVEEGIVQLSSGETVRRYRQYELVPGATKSSATPPRPVEGNPTPGSSTTMGTIPAAVPGTHYDPAQWTVSRVPKSTVDNMQAFLPVAERAFADFHQQQVQGVVTTQQSGQWFRHQFDGVTYAGFYNYDGSNASSLSVNSIFVDAYSIP